MKAWAFRLTKAALWRSVARLYKLKKAAEKRTEKLIEKRRPGTSPWSSVNFLNVRLVGTGVERTLQITLQD